MSLLSILSAVLSRRLALTGAAAAGLVAAVPEVRAQTGTPHVYRMPVPLAIVGPASSAGEAVGFTGVGMLRTRVSRDAETGARTLLAEIDLNGIVGTGLPSQTRYRLASVESMVFPHQARQTLEVTFPMEPVSGPQLRLRTGVLKLVVQIDLNTGAALAINSTSLVLL